MNRPWEDRSNCSQMCFLSGEHWFMRSVYSRSAERFIAAFLHKPAIDAFRRWDSSRAHFRNCWVITTGTAVRLAVKYPGWSDAWFNVLCVIMCVDIIQLLMYYSIGSSKSQSNNTTALACSFFTDLHTDTLTNTFTPQGTSVWFPRKTFWCKPKTTCFNSKQQFDRRDRRRIFSCSSSTSVLVTGFWLGFRQ